MTASVEQEIRKRWKKIEDEINRKLFDESNSLAAIRIAASIMEAHLDHLEVHRQLAELLLTNMNLPSRDDIALLAIKMIEKEARLDALEEALHNTMVEIDKTGHELIKITANLTETTAGNRQVDQ